MKKALITGIDGQDGSYLSEFLLKKGYQVHGIVRRVALEDPEHQLWRIRHILKKITLHSGSLESFASLFKVVHKMKPDECYHLAAQSFVSYSFEDEFSTINTNINGTHYILAAIKALAPRCKFYFAASSEMFGKVRETPQNENTPFHPRSPYGISKVAGFDLTRNYREGYGMFACNGILFNHESPRRGFEFVTRKITNAVAQIKFGLAKELRLGNLDAKRDWGFSGDYIEAMWLMLQQDKQDDYVIATGETHTVKEFVRLAFSHARLDWKKYVKIDKNFYRPAEVHRFRSVFCDEYTRNRQTGSFNLIDPITHATAASGMIIERGRLPSMVRPDEKTVSLETFIHRQEGVVLNKDRERILKQRPATLWLTGLSGSGKSTVAYEVEKKLIVSGHLCYVLDGDDVRHGLNRDLGFSPQDRSENIRRVAEVARLLNEAGMIVITAFISPYREDREQAKKIIGEDRFIEVFLDAPIEICEKRDPKGLYEKARAGLIPEFTGVNAPYEAPEAPALWIKTSELAADLAAENLCLHLREKGFLGETR